MKKRMIIIGILILVGLGALTGQLVRIQLIETEHYSTKNINLLQNSVKQRVEEITLDNGRGGFLDRTGQPLSYTEKSVLVMFPFVKHLQWPSNKVSAILGVDEVSLREALKKENKPFIYEDMDNKELSEEQIKQINDLHIPGIIAVNKRFAMNQPLASHLIGTLTLNKDEIDMVNEKGINQVNYQTKVGRNGLEKSFEDFLHGEGSKRLVYHKAANGLPLFGVDIRYIDENQRGDRINIQTTIDRDYQELAEKTAELNGIKNGGVVLLDIESNDVLAMVSKPEKNPDSYEDRGNLNQMIIPQVPGSVFKTVIAAAAIEEGLSLDRVFDGNVDHLDRPVDERSGRLLGSVNFQQGFALSSNQVFGRLGRELAQKDPNLIEVYAEKLGLLSKAGWEGDVFHTHIKQLSEEKPGIVWSDENIKKDLNYVANTSIGQMNVKISPLAIANMMATIARGGDRKMVRAASKAVDENGLTIASFQSQKAEGSSISSMTASKLQELLRGVVTTTGQYSTAGNLHTAKYEVAGKSGTAEIGKKEEKSEQQYNKWFAGYFPFKEPKYALVVVNLGVQENSGSVNPTYLQMVNGIYEINQKRKLAESVMSER